MTKPPASGILEVLLYVEAASAAFGYLGGVMFFVDPSGTSYGLEPLLASLPVEDFLPVGLWLFVVYGIGFSVVTIALRNRSLWAWSSAVLLSCVWIVWVGAETVLWGPDPGLDIWLLPPALGLVLLVWLGMRERFGRVRMPPVPV